MVELKAIIIGNESATFDPATAEALSSLDADLLEASADSPELTVFFLSKKWWTVRSTKAIHHGG